MNNRERMRATNKKARIWLLAQGYDDIWLKPHTIRKDYVFTQKGTYLAMDLWNLFDGICTGGSGCGIYYLQIKTNSWAKEEPIKEFCKIHPQTNVLVLNYSKGKMLLRRYN